MLLLTVVKQEIIDHIRSVRTVSVISLCILLIPFSIYINYKSYEVKSTDYLEESLLFERSQHGANPYVFRFFRSPSTLSPFTEGLDSIFPRHFTILQTGTEPGPSMATETSSMVAIFGNLDFLFIVQVIFSLLAILLTYDAIVGEKETGTLRLVLSNAVPRDVIILGKYLGGYLTLIVPFTFSFFFGVLLISLDGYPLFPLETIERLIALWGLSLLYISIFFWLGLFISCYIRSSKGALIALLLIWVLTVFVIPKVAYASARILCSTRTDLAVNMEKTSTREHIQKAKGLKLGDGYRRIIGNLSYRDPDWPKVWNAYAEFRKPIAQEYENQLRRKVEEIDHAHQMEKAVQEHLGVVLSRLSPAAVLTYAMTTLTGTGMLEKDLYFTAIRRYWKALDQEIFSKIWEDRIDSSRPGHTDITIEQGIYNEMPPREKYPQPTLVKIGIIETLDRNFWDMGLLVIFNILLFAAAYIKFLRYKL